MAARRQYRRPKEFQQACLDPELAQQLVDKARTEGDRPCPGSCSSGSANKTSLGKGFIETLHLLAVCDPTTTATAARRPNEGASDSPG
jgi:hypothetical protein